MTSRPGFWRAAFSGLTVLALALPAATARAQETDRPYVVEDGKVDQGTYNGFRRYHSDCHVCHGPDGLGSSFAPGLIDSLKALSFDEFIGIVAQGRESIAGGKVLKMPGFASNPNVMDHIQDIYAYLKARSDGAIGRGRPQRLARP